MLTTPEPEEHLELKSYAAAEEIERGKLPPEELLSLPMFKVSEFRALESSLPSGFSFPPLIVVCSIIALVSQRVSWLFD